MRLCVGSLRSRRMDPISAGAVVSLGTGAVTSLLGHGAKQAAAVGWRKVRSAGRYDASWLDLGRDSNRLGISAKDVRSIEEFLDSAAIRPLLSLAAIVSLYAVGDSRLHASEVLSKEFENQAKQWTNERGEDWSKAATSIWEELSALYDSDLARVRGLGQISRAIEEYGGFLRVQFSRDGKRPKGAAEDYLDRLTELASDVSRLANVSRTTDRLTIAVRESGHKAIINHAETDRHAEFDKLYVERTIYRNSGDEAQESKDITEADSGFRMVLTGDPGAGKSTFVSHLQNRFANDPVAPVPTVILRCREILTRAWSKGITEYVVDVLRSNYDLSVSRGDIADLLTLGRLVCIFDGLDEITQVPQRLEMVDRIHVFARNYPATSMLVTSRSIGYHRAPLSERIFEQFELREFTPAQIVEYARKWFDLAERPDLFDPFMHECRTVADLTPNPLMLSLLCILYRNRGTIPRNRRQIYAKCADLLFHRWDRHRAISQPEDLPSYGDKIMQEIARWFYSSQSAQDGVEEQVIAKTIATHLHDHGGVSTDEARRRADDFLAFCADRAWLLAATGTSRAGARLFGFTHRTFLEFFAAEALSRMAESPGKVAEIVRESYARDATSVMPELLMQAYDDRTYRGAENIAISLLTEDAEAELVLRVMDGVSLPARVRESAFNLVVNQWQRNRSLDALTFRALFSLNPDARDQFAELYLDASRAIDGDMTALRNTLHGWAMFENLGISAMFDDRWQSILLAATPAYLSGKGDAAVDDWLIGRGVLDASRAIKRHLLRVPSHIAGPLLGVGWRACEEAIFASSGDTISQRDGIVKLTADAFQNGKLLRVGEAGELVDRIITKLSHLPPAPHSATKDASLANVRNVILGVLCLAHECDVGDPSLFDFGTRVVSPRVGALFAYYDSAVREGETPRAAVGNWVDEVLEDGPPWCRKWVSGRLDLRIVETTPRTSPW